MQCKHNTHPFFNTQVTLVLRLYLHLCTETEHQPNKQKNTNEFNEQENKISIMAYTKLKLECSTLVDTFPVSLTLWVLLITSSTETAVQHFLLLWTGSCEINLSVCDSANEEVSGCWWLLGLKFARKRVYMKWNVCEHTAEVRVTWCENGQTGWILFRLPLRFDLSTVNAFISYIHTYTWEYVPSNDEK